LCLSCGCNSPSDSHNDSRHITYADLVSAATAANITPKQAAKNIRKGLKASKDAPPVADVVPPEVTLRPQHVARMDPLAGFRPK
jgi:hypothetical protein